MPDEVNVPSNFFVVVDLSILCVNLNVNEVNLDLRRCFDLLKAPLTRSLKFASRAVKGEAPRSVGTRPEVVPQTCNYVRYSRRLKYTRPTIASSPRWNKTTRGYSFQWVLGTSEYVIPKSAEIGVSCKTPRYNWLAHPRMV